MTCDPFSLSAEADGPPFETVEGKGRLVLLCDHASNRVPASLGDLGLAPAEFERHIAYDIGMRGVTLSLARRLGAPAVLSRFSRLVIDPNRGPDDPTLLMRLSDGAIVPGNRHVDAAGIARRREALHAPYHRAVSAVLDGIAEAGETPLIVSMHSFTPAWKGYPRPWHVGLLWDRDDRVAKPLIAALRAEGDLIVGDNEPYDGALVGDTMHTHGTDRGFPHVLAEIRQDLVRDVAGQEAWAERFARLLPPLLDIPETAQVAHYGSRAEIQETQGMTDIPNADPATRDALEAEVFRRLVRHLRDRPDVQNIDLMNLADFCRNCLSNWLKNAADARGLALTKEQSREVVYGMPYEEWKARHQKEATPEQQATFAAGEAARNH